LLIRLGFVLRPLLRTHLLLLTLTPACSCVYICKFQFRPIHPPLGDYQRPTTRSPPSRVLVEHEGPRGIRPNVTGPARLSVLRARFVRAFL
jgi:hypothetical protein